MEGRPKSAVGLSSYDFASAIQPLKTGLGTSGSSSTTSTPQSMPHSHHQQHQQHAHDASAAGPGPGSLRGSVTVCDINPDMLAEGKKKASAARDLAGVVRRLGVQCRTWGGCPARRRARTQAQVEDCRDYVANKGFNEQCICSRSTVCHAPFDTKLSQHIVEDSAFDEGLHFEVGNAEALGQFRDAQFDAYTIAFGIRNVTDREAALAEAYRVLKPGGR
eukprot:1161813-Pelagomonas_calceolata.AAC.12